MADDNPTAKLKTAKRRLRDADIPDNDEQAILEFLDAKDERKVNVHPGYTADGEQLGTFKPSTLWSYCTRLTLVTKRSDKPLTDMKPEDVNAFTQSLLDGTHPDVKDAGLSQNTVSNTQATLRTFYEWTDYGPAKDEIVMLAPSESTVDERDVYNRDDIGAMRDALDHPRDLALFDMLIYTGQRITALLTLRLKDVDPSEGVYWLNTNAEGLKRAEGKRPLLGATKAVRDWVRYHPAGDNPDADLFVPKRAGPGDFEESVGHSAVWKVLRDAKEQAGVDKPCNPHTFRHTWVTLVKVEYEMDDATIKHLGGWSPDSTVMETTYSHLTDDDFIQKAEEKFGIRQPDKSTLTPSTCGTCGEPLAPGSKACPSCGDAFTPDAKQAQDQIQQDIGAAKVLSVDVDGLDESDIDALADDDALMAELIRRRAD